MMTTTTTMVKFWLAERFGCLQKLPPRERELLVFAEQAHMGCWWSAACLAWVSWTNSNTTKRWRWENFDDLSHYLLAKSKPCLICFLFQILVKEKNGLTYWSISIVLWNFLLRSWGFRGIIGFARLFCVACKSDVMVSNFLCGDPKSVGVQNVQREFTFNDQAYECFDIDSAIDFSSYKKS